ncbi:MAG: hypothetical protein KA749_09750 [Acidovorax sp.]|nr:hypothetical protein [Acidovorax sp.]
MAARTAWRGVAVGWLCGLGLLAATQAQTSQAADTYARVQREREALAQELPQAEAACYQRFAVEDCLSDVRKRHRQALAQLRQQEQAMRAQERQQQQRERAQQLQEKQQAQPPVRSMPPASSALVAREREQAQAQAERASAAAARAQQQRERLQAQQSREAQRAAQVAERETAARAQFQQKQQAAQQRRIRYEQAQQERQATNQPQAADLPVPQGLAPSASAPLPQAAGQ